MKALIGAMLVLMLAVAAYAGYGKGWHEPQGKELQLRCYSTATGTKCANMWVGGCGERD